MTEYCGIVKRIEEYHRGTILVIDQISGPPVVAEWHTWHFKYCHRDPIVGDKVYLLYDDGRWRGSFSPFLNRKLDWTKVGF